MRRSLRRSRFCRESAPKSSPARQIRKFRRKSSPPHAVSSPLGSPDVPAAQEPRTKCPRPAPRHGGFSDRLLPLLPHPARWPTWVPSLSTDSFVSSASSFPEPGILRSRGRDPETSTLPFPLALVTLSPALCVDLDYSWGEGVTPAPGEQPETRTREAPMTMVNLEGVAVTSMADFTHRFLGTVSAVLGCTAGRANTQLNRPGNQRCICDPSSDSLDTQMLPGPGGQTSLLRETAARSRLWSGGTFSKQRPELGQGPVGGVSPTEPGADGTVRDEAGLAGPAADGTGRGAQSQSHGVVPGGQGKVVKPI